MTNLERMLEQRKTLTIIGVPSKEEIKDQMIAVMFEALAFYAEDIPTMSGKRKNIAMKTIEQIEQLAAQALGEK